MKRRTYLGFVGASAAALAGCAGIQPPQSESRVDYRGEAEIVYDHEDLTLQAFGQAVRLGEKVAFEVTNTGDSKTILGCHNPWAVQKHSEDGWQHVAWTGDNYYQLCATELSPGESLVEKFEFSESGLRARTDDVNAELHPGTYRFVLLGPSPFLAVDFDVRE